MISRILNRRNLGLNNKFYTRNIYNSFKNLNNQVNNENDSQGFQTLDESRKKFEFKYADKLSKRVKEYVYLFLNYGIILTNNGITEKALVV